MTNNDKTEAKPTPRERALIIREPDKTAWTKAIGVLSNRGWFSVLLGSAAVLFSLWMVLAYASSWRTENVLSGMESDVELRTRKANAELQDKILRQAELANQEAFAVASSKLSLALREVSSAGSAIDQLKANTKAIQVETDQFLDGPLGRKVVSDAAMIEEVESLVGVASDTESVDVELLQEQLSTLAKPLLDAQKDLPADFSPSSEILGAVRELKRQAERDDQASERTLLSLRDLTSRASKLTSMSETTLRSLLAQRATDRRSAELRQLAEQLEISRRENAAMTTNATIAKERQIAEAEKSALEKIAREEAERIRIEAKRKADDLADVNERKRKAAEATKLEQEFQRDLPAIRQYLSPLFGNGYSLRGKESSKPGPASYSHLVTLGTEAATQDGLIHMIKVLDAGWNDRTTTKWGSADYRYLKPTHWGQLDMTTLQAAHDLFRKYGKTLKDKGMLDP
ncbi:coiled-coil domain-containing protein [Rubripirellula reticaptiva]|uniref:Uncharacterized protein n=1 Tax=Rubripirellula reticaptiva TaxID=2528013 RepID=A0A5C6F625_9BACT|nr:hypothetical protein [Rubripirellula reticaptiva]TWU56010.1 hypothetical protein Poly59_23130 [Rubripirellula reticaptiva]